MTIEIPLSKGYVAIVDDEDADLAELKWSADVKSTGHAYGHRTLYGLGRKRNHELLHRVILGRKLGRKLTSHEYVDHINGDTLDTRRSNLRLATWEQNTRNRKLNCNSSTGFKGVSKRPGYLSYRARIHVDGQCISIGDFPTDIDAAIAYNHAAQKHYGEFARFNDIPGWEQIIPKPTSRLTPRRGKAKDAA